MSSDDSCQHRNVQKRGVRWASFVRLHCGGRHCALTDPSISAAASWFRQAALGADFLSCPVSPARCFPSRSAAFAGRKARLWGAGCVPGCALRDFEALLSLNPYNNLTITIALLHEGEGAIPDSICQQRSGPVWNQVQGPGRRHRVPPSGCCWCPPFVTRDDLREGLKGSKRPF